MLTNFYTIWQALYWVNLQHNIYCEAISPGEWILEFHAAGAQSSDAHGELSQKQQINFPKVVQQQYVGEVDKLIIAVLQINSV